MTDNDLVKWLQLQIDGDEQWARSAMGDTAGEWAEFGRPFPEIVLYDKSGRLTVGHVRHIARHDPAHVLNMVAAHRAIIDEVMSWQHFYLDEDGWYSCSQAVDPSESDAEPGSGCLDGDRAGKPCDCGLDRRRRAILGPLTAGYAGRDGYRQEWRP